VKKFNQVHSGWMRELWERRGVNKKQFCLTCARGDGKRRGGPKAGIEKKKKKKNRKGALFS